MVDGCIHVFDVMLTTSLAALKAEAEDQAAVIQVAQLWQCDTAPVFLIACLPFSACALKTGA